MSVVFGTVGVTTVSYDGLDAENLTDQIEGVAPLERLRMCTSVDSSVYETERISAGLPGNFVKNFDGAFVVVKEGAGTPSIAEIKEDGIKVPEQDISMGIPLIVYSFCYSFRVPTEWAGLVYTVSMVWRMRYATADNRVDYVIVPIQVTVNAQGTVVLDSITDQDGNTINKRVCKTDDLREIWATFSLGATPTPTNYNFIPLIAEEGGAWQEDDGYVHDVLAQLDSGLILSADTVFSAGGLATVRIDARRLDPTTTYCITAIAKDGALSPPTQATPIVCPNIDISAEQVIESLNTYDYVVQLEIIVTSAPGLTVTFIGVTPSSWPSGTAEPLGWNAPAISTVESQGIYYYPTTLDVTLEYCWMVEILAEDGSGNVCRYSRLFCITNTTPLNPPYDDTTIVNLTLAPA